MVKILQTKQTKNYINRTGGNTNRCNFMKKNTLQFVAVLSPFSKD